MTFKVATWIRECDEENVGRFFASHSQIQLRNARREAVDVSDTHGLLLTGGPDISAEFHHEPPHDPSLIEHPEPVRDAWEVAAARAAYARGLPLFCICKGVQVLNVALGGTLHLDIRGHNLPEQKLHNIQPVRYDATARQRFELVNSSHHQALDRVAAPLEVEGWCATDGTIEQVRVRDYPFGLGVQYHPERDLTYTSLFEEFITHVKNAAT